MASNATFVNYFFYAFLIALLFVILVYFTRFINWLIGPEPIQCSMFRCSASGDDEESQDPRRCDYEQLDGEQSAGTDDTFLP